jgi:hypothetical protein
MYVAGTVTVLRGYVTWTPIGPGTSRAVLPTLKVAEQTVAANATYRLVLDPGSYVLEGQYAGPASASPSPLRPFASVIVTAGHTSAAPIPNDCM